MLFAIVILLRIYVHCALIKSAHVTFNAEQNEAEEEDCCGVVVVCYGTSQTPLPSTVRYSFIHPSPFIHSFNETLKHSYALRAY